MPKSSEVSPQQLGKHLIVTIMGGSCSCLNKWFKLTIPTSSTPLSIYGDTIIESLKGPNSMQTIEEKIEHSKTHWSQVSKFQLEVDEVVEVSNMEVFQTLQSHPKWGTFFVTFGKDGIGELVMGLKFAEGGQAELYDVKIQWNDPMMNEEDLQHGYKYVLKVFKKGTSLRQLQLQWPLGMFRDYVNQKEWRCHGNLSQARVLNDVCHGMLLEDGRFAFLMLKADEDLRHQIDCLLLTIKKNCCPYSESYVETLMYCVAEGVEWLHNCGIIHRDLKASNILLKKFKDGWTCRVADYECSNGVIGTGFFRAPEILQACKDYSINNKPELFTKEADVYSYGMVCYEILIGRLPFDDYRQNDFDHVLLGERPKLPKFVDGWMRELLSMYWEANPVDRPSIKVILKILLANSKKCRKLYALRDKIDVESVVGTTMPLVRRAMSIN